MDSEQKADMSLSLRVAVLESLKKFNDSEEMKENIGLLLMNFTQERICEPDFTGLMEATMLFCGKSDATMLARFEDRIDTMLDI